MQIRGFRDWIIYNHVIMCESLFATMVQTLTGDSVSITFNSMNASAREKVGRVPFPALQTETVRQKSRETEESAI